MAVSQQITRCERVEAAELFTVGFDLNDQPIQKPVSAMSDDEQVAALHIAKEEMDRTHDAAAHLLPLAEIGYVPSNIEMIYQVLDKLLPAMEAGDRALRLADAVQAKAAH
jgi:hypothetical protein